MNFINNFIVRKVLLGVLKGLLDKLPLSGRKTVLSVLVLFVGELISYFGPRIPFDLGYFLEVLKSAGDYTIAAGTAGAITGVIHKVLKWLDERINGKKVEDSGWESLQ